MKIINISPIQMEKQDDWRPVTYLSGGAVLRGMGEDWPLLGELAEGCVDGWRVSCNPSALNYDPAVKTTPLYRLRNVRPYWIETEQMHLKVPQVAGKPFCAEPFDIIIRKVGEPHAALMTISHGRHPVDANLALIRGLSQVEAVWVCFCLNQPMYQEYLNESDAIGALVRLGLKKIRGVPVCPMPESVRKLASLYMNAYTRLVDAQQMLAAVRQQVEEWVDGLLAGFDWDFWVYSETCRGQFFSPRYIADTLHIPQVEQEYLRIQLIEQYGLKSIADLAIVNPAGGESDFGKNGKVLQISNISEHLALKVPLLERTDEMWRTQSRSLSQDDVLLSTFAENARVAYLDIQPDELVYPSGHIAALRFQKYPGAYALLMESRVVRMQLERLAMSGALRFIQFSQLDKIVLPEPDRATAKFWHEKVVEHHEKSRHAQVQLDELLQKMVPVFNEAHSNKKISAKEQITVKGGPAT